MKKIVNLKKEEILKFFDKYDSLRKIFIELNVNSNGSGAYRTFRNHCKNLNIEIPKFKRSFDYDKNNAKFSLEEILIENSQYQSRDRLKIRLIREGLLINNCYECGIVTWNGKPLVLQLEHKNGVYNDNRIKNLSLLCPNCHSQTKTYAGKNKKSKIVKKKKDIIKKERPRKVKNRPSKEELEKMLQETSYVAIGRVYGVSDNAVRKWRKLYEKQKR